MTLLLKTDWRVWLKSSQADWNAGGALIADVAKEFRPSDGKLSMFRVTETVSKEQVACALERRRLRDSSSQEPREVGCALIEEGLLGTWGYEIEESEGGTGDVDVDKEHIDVVHLTFTSLCDLANHLWDVFCDDDAAGVVSVTVPAEEIRRRIAQ